VILARSGIVEKTGTAWWKIECETDENPWEGVGDIGTGEEETTYESDTFTHDDPDETEQQTISRTKYCEEDNEIATGGECIAINPEKTEVVGNGQVNSDETGYTCVFKGKNQPDSDLYYTPEGKIKVTCVSGEEEEEEEEGNPVSGTASPGEESITVIAPCEEGTEVTGGKCDQGDDSEVSDQGTTDNNEYFCTFESTSPYAPNSPNYVPPSGTATPKCTLKEEEAEEEEEEIIYSDPNTSGKEITKTKNCMTGQIATGGECSPVDEEETEIISQDISSNERGYTCTFKGKPLMGSQYLQSYYSPSVIISVECEKETEEENNNQANNDEEETNNEETTNEEEIQESKCEDCGKGLFNVCDEAECLSLGDCNFTSGFLGGKCEPAGQGEEKKEEQEEAAGELFSIKVSPSSVSVPVGGTCTFTLKGYDKKLNEVSLDPSKASWTKCCGVGDLSPTTGLTTTYTAPSITGTRNVSGHYGSLGTGATIYVISGN
jgi:hypothetical protein